MKKYILTTLFILCFMLLGSMIFKSDAVAGVNDRYWVGGDGSWSDTNHWSTESGGTPGAAVPTSANDVYFDGVSGGSIVTVDITTRYTKSLDFTGFTGTLTGTKDLYIYGSLTFVPGMGYTYTGNMYFRGIGNHNITTAGKSINNADIGTSTSTYTLLDNLNTNSTTFFIAGGTLDLNGKQIDCANFNASNYTTVRTITGSGIINAISWYSQDITNLTSNNFTGTINDTGYFNGGGINLTGAIVNLTGAGAHALSGTNTFKNFTVSGTVTGSDSFNVTNDFTVNAGATYSHTGTVTMTAAADTTGTITTNGVTLASPITINAPSATVTLGSAINIGTKTLTLTAGTFDTSASNYAVTCGSFIGSGTTTRALNMRNSTFTCSDNPSIGGWLCNVMTSMTLTEGGSTIALTNGGVFRGGNETYNIVEITGITATPIIYGYNTISTLTVTGGSNNTGILQLTADQIVTTLNISGASAVNRLWLKSDTLGTARTITCNGSCNLSNCDLQDITGAGEGWANGMVTNGQFTSNTSGWTPIVGSTLTSEGGGQSGNCLKALGDGNSYPGAYQTWATIIGHSYTFKYWHKNGNDVGEVEIGNGASPFAWNYYDSGLINDADWVQRSVTFTAIGTSTTTTILGFTNTAGKYTYYDSIQLIDNSVGGGTLAGDTGITFKTPASISWTGGTGNWNDSTHWTGGVVPLIQDNAIFDNSSFNNVGQIVTMNMRLIPSLDTSSYSEGQLPNLALSQHTGMFGSTFNTTGMGSITSTPWQLSFYGRSNLSFTPGGSNYNIGWLINKTKGAITTLGSDLTMTGGANAYNRFQIDYGTFDANGKNININGLYLSGTAVRTLILGSGTWTLRGIGTSSDGLSPVYAGDVSNLTLNKTNSNILVTGSGSTIDFSGGGIPYNNVTFQPGSDSISTVYKIKPNNTFNVITADSTNGAMTLSFQATYITTLTNFAQTGTKKLNIISDTPGTKATLSKTTGIAPISLKGGYTWDINFTGGAKWVLTNLDIWKTTHPTGGATAPTGVKQYWNPHVINN